MKNEIPNYYAIIPANVRYDSELNANSKLLYGEITSLANKYGYCLSTNEYFSKLYNVSTRTITDWIKILEKKDYIRCEIETKRYDDGTIKKYRKIYINHIEVLRENHIEVSPQNHIEVLRKNHIEENFLYNNTSNINNIKETNNINIISKESKKNFTKPTLEEVKQYCEERNNNIDAELFIDFYNSNGWKVGKNPMKDWKASIRTWEKNHKPKETNKKPTVIYEAI